MTEFHKHKIKCKDGKTREVLIWKSEHVKHQYCYVGKCSVLNVKAFGRSKVEVLDLITQIVNGVVG